MPTLTALVDALRGHLHPATDAPLPDREVTAVHVSEITDPTPFLEGGELILTTGLALTGNAAQARAYAARLRKRDIAALGFGLKVVHDEVPQSLVRACAAVGLPLLLVPGPTPFLLLARRYWSLVADEGTEELSAALDAHRELVRAAAGRNPVAAVVRCLAGAVHGWAAQLNLDGEMLEVWPRSRRWSASQVGAEVARLRVTGPHSSATFPLGADDVVLHPLSVSGHAMGFLATGCPRPMKPAARQLVLAATALLALEGEQRRKGLHAARAIRACVARLVIAGFTQAAQSLASESGLPRLPPRLCMLGVTELASHTVDEIWDRVESRAASADSQVIATVVGESLWMLLPPSKAGGALEVIRRFIVERDPSARALLSADVALAGVHQHFPGLAHALSELAEGEVRDSTDPKSPHDQTPELGKLIAYHRSELVPAVTAYLRHRGHWERAAGELGVHRNTLRHRIATANRILGKELDDPDVASRLWLALRDRGLA
jgi:purine catabolism regulator